MLIAEYLGPVLFKLAMFFQELTRLRHTNNYIYRAPSKLTDFTKVVGSEKIPEMFLSAQFKDYFLFIYLPRNIKKNHSRLYGRNAA